MPSRREHCLASQRTGFESSKIVVEHVHGVVDEFLGKSHTSVVDGSGDLTEVHRFLHYLHDHLLARGFSDECANLSAECKN